MKDLLKDPSGKFSTTRTLQFAVTIIFMITWAVISVQRGYLVPVSGSMIAIFGILGGQKSLQSFAEHIGGKNAKQSTD